MRAPLEEQADIYHLLLRNRVIIYDEIEFYVIYIYIYITHDVRLKVELVARN